MSTRDGILIGRQGLVKKNNGNVVFSIGSVAGSGDGGLHSLSDYTDSHCRAPFLHTQHRRNVVN